MVSSQLHVVNAIIATDDKNKESKMAKLTYQKRKRMRGTSFALEKERKYPIDTIARGRNALARVAQHGTLAEQAEVKREVYAKYPSLRKENDKMNRPPKIKVFNGKRYELAGTSPTKSKKVIEEWASFQREVNNNNVRIIETPSGYEAYMRKGKARKSKLTIPKTRITPKRPRIS